MEFLKHQFDKLILLFVWLVMIAVWVYLRGDKEAAQYAGNAASGAIGALLTIITGKMLNQQNTTINDSDVRVTAAKEKPPA